MTEHNNHLRVCSEPFCTMSNANMHSSLRRDPSTYSPNGSLAQDDILLTSIVMSINPLFPFEKEDSLGSIRDLANTDGQIVVDCSLLLLLVLFLCLTGTSLLAEDDVRESRESAGANTCRQAIGQLVGGSDVSVVLLFERIALDEAVATPCGEARTEDGPGGGGFTPLVPGLEQALGVGGTLGGRLHLGIRGLLLCLRRFTPEPSLAGDLVRIPADRLDLEMDLPAVRQGDTVFGLDVPRGRARQILGIGLSFLGLLRNRRGIEPHQLLDRVRAVMVLGQSLVALLDERVGTLSRGREFLDLLRGCVLEDLVARVLLLARHSLFELTMRDLTSQLTPELLLPRLHRGYSRPQHRVGVSTVDTARDGLRLCATLGTAVDVVHHGRRSGTRRRGIGMADRRLSICADICLPHGRTGQEQEQTQNQRTLHDGTPI